jgi:acylphosphatase
VIILKIMKAVRAHVIIEGFVQGVFFRANTADVARTHGVGGWVRNNYDGTVEAVFEGEEEAVKKVLGWCHRGPPGARVENVITNWEDSKGEFDDFSIRFR